MSVPNSQQLFFLGFCLIDEREIIAAIGCRTLLDFLEEGDAERNLGQDGLRARQQEATDWFIAYVKKDENEE